MTVGPGAGRQDYLEQVETKITGARRMLDLHRPATRIDVDGGMAPDTIVRARRAGADTFVSGSSILEHRNGKAPPYGISPRRSA